MTEHSLPIKGSVLNRVSMLQLCLVVMALVFAAYNYLLYNRITAQYLASELDYSRAVQMKETVQICDNTMLKYLSTGNRAYLAEHNTSVQIIQQGLVRLHTTAGTAEIRAILRSMGDAFYSYQTSSNYAAFYQTQSAVVQSSAFLRQAQKISGYLQRYCDDLLLHMLEANRSYYLRQKENQFLVLVLNLSLFSALSGGAVLALWYLRSAFSRPLQHIYHAAQRLGEGDLAVRVQVDTQFSEEMLRIVAGAFNNMADNLVAMMEDVRRKGELEKQLLGERLKTSEYAHLLEQANFLALQSQVNPHFMFNTLNSISRTVTLGRSDAAVSMIEALSDLLRYNLQDAELPALLREEIDIVRQYITIQQYRFGQHVRVVYAYDEALAARVRLPRFTLQPLVENAVIHGLEPKQEGGTVTLRVWAEQNFCHVEIADDGLGVAQSRLDKLLAGMKIVRQGRSGSIGLCNTAKRLRLFTRRDDALTITSQPNHGTMAHILLPMEDEGCTS